MVLLHGRAPKGTEMIAARWAVARDLTQVVFKPDWKSHGKATRFKHNDEMLEILSQGLIATPSLGITENIVDKARMLKVRVKRIGV
ncbi:MAG: SLOG family protein [Tateyamaria sp.]|uniref:SLOG family protein n=1 Tax=Tateyamaria sp. TaxID=1929288 RepID=UPI003282A169